ncbi:MAG: transcription antitermination factor NusB [Anaerosomatales bacterium]
MSAGERRVFSADRMQERSRARLQALQILYQSDITGVSPASILADGSYNSEDGEPSEFCRSLIAGTEEHLAEIDEAITRTSKHWVISRMPLVDRNILRLATYEILHLDSIPVSVSINEAVEMAKVYGGEDSSRFVNGVLGRIAETDGAETNEDGVDG